MAHAGSATTTLLLVLTLCAPRLAAAQDQDDGGGDSGAVLAFGEDTKLEFDGRVYALWRLTDEAEAPRNQFLLSSVRLQATWRQGDWLDAVLELEAEQAIQTGSAVGLLRDAYVKVSPLPWLRIVAGQFKRPFSRLELLPLRRVPTVGRGMVNRWMVGRLGYGARDIGLGITGRIWDDARLDYSVGVFNGNGAGMDEGGFAGFKDFSARLDARPVRWLALGLSFSLDTLEDGDLLGLVDPAIFADVDPDEFPAGYTAGTFRREHAWMKGSWWMCGADVFVRIAGVHLLAEAMFGQNWWFQNQPYTAGLTFLASYEIELSSEWDIRLEPLAELELIVPRTGVPDSRMWRALVGANLRFGDHLRLMIDGDFTRVEGAEPDEVTREGWWPREWPGTWAGENRLSVQLAFNV